MEKTTSKITFGNRQARALCSMSHATRLDFIAEGLPIILGSAQGFWNAACRLKDDSREASVLEGFAEEEAAKVLVLMDLVRCPSAQVNARIGRIVRKIFYDHLARLIYAKAQSWRPVNVAQLQEYIDTERQGHYLEGGMSEYIVPNWALYSRESTMYADIEVHEDEQPRWSDPRHWSGIAMQMQPLALQLAEALSALGIFTRRGLQATSDIWGQVDFVDKEGPAEARDLARLLAEQLELNGLVTEAADESHVRSFYNLWQLPMYNLEFGKIEVSMEKLVAEREAAFWSEVG